MLPKRRFLFATLSLAAAAGCADRPASVDATTSSAGALEARPSTLRVLTTGLFAPWEITWGPDDQLWITERVGRRITRLDPTTGARTAAVVIGEAYQTVGQDGVLGMALHPELLQGTGHDYVYVAYTYLAGEAPLGERSTKIVRFTFDADSEKLIDPIDVLTGLPGHDDHNSGRLKYGPDGRLYYTIGEGGNNQFGNKCKPIRAQDLPTAAQVAAKDWQAYQGKVLRLDPDGGIPVDNPTFDGVQSHVYSYGHRNAQGLAFAADGTLYASEQGPKTDDEVNRIEAGKNYGWPHVAGFIDDKAYAYGNWSAAPDCADLEFSDYEVPPSVPVATESSWCHDDVFVPPLATFYTVDSDHDFHDPKCAGSEYICWPTVAPSSIDYFPGDEGGWRPSLLVPALKTGTVYRVPLNDDGTAVEGNIEPLFQTTNRYRDLAISPDGTRFFVITDSEGTTQTPDREATSKLDTPGAVLEFTLTDAQPR